MWKMALADNFTPYLLLKKPMQLPPDLKPPSPELTNVSSFKTTNQKCFNELHDN